MSNVDVKWMVRPHMPSVLAIEGLSFEFPWKEEDFIRALSQRDCIGMSAMLGDQVVGFMIFGIFRNRIELQSIAVHPNFRRMFVGSAMIDKLASRLDPQRRNRIELFVRETNIVALNFFKSLGFLATGLVQDKYEETNEDAIVMRYVAKLVERSYQSVPANQDARVK